MSDYDFPTGIFDELDQDISLEDLGSNQRIAVRYKRKDIDAVVKVRSLLFPRLHQVVLYDISSKGAAVVCPKKLSKRSRVCLYLKFKDGKRFEIDAVVVYADSTHKYGLKFDKYHEALANHLLDSQTDLTFS